MRRSFNRKKDVIKKQRIKVKNLRMYKKGRQKPRHISFQELLIFTEGIVKRSLTSPTILDPNDYRIKKPKEKAK